MTKKDRFVCWLPCKPYVKQFLLYNFNAPDDTWTEIVNLSPDKELQNDFLSRLAKPGRYENRYRNLARYTANVAVEIRRDDFYRYGWAMSNTEVVAFGSKVERRIKQMLFLYLDTHVSIGIRREYNRHGYRKTVENTTILDFINRIILGKLSEFGTISQQGKMTYESNAL